MKHGVVVGVLTAMLAGAGWTSLAQAEGTNQRERFFLKHQKCAWTDEMGKFIYECVKDNDGFNAHWCHNEAIDKFCPVDDAAAAGQGEASSQDKEQL